MNVAAFIVAAMNIHHIIECSSPGSARFDILLSTSHLVFYFVHKFCCVTAHDEIFGSCLFLVINCLRSPIHRESSLRTLRNAHFCREVLHDEEQLVASYSKKFCQVFLIDRAPQLHFSTLEKIKIDHNLLLNNLVVKVSPIDRLPTQISQDVDNHTRSSPDLMKLKKTRTKAFSLLNSS